MPEKLDLIGKKFGKYLVIKDGGSDKNYKSVWVCNCDCGNVCIVHGNNL
jgi:hypothetical protein